jgi:hypothetical protein
VAPVGQAPKGHLPPQAVRYRDTSCHRHVPAGALFAHLSGGHASMGWGATPLVLAVQHLAAAITRAVPAVSNKQRVPRARVATT